MKNVTLINAHSTKFFIYKKNVMKKRTIAKHKNQYVWLNMFVKKKLVSRKKKAQTSYGISK